MATPFSAQPPFQVVVIQEGLPVLAGILAALIKMHFDPGL